MLLRLVIVWLEINIVIIFRRLDMKPIITAELEIVALGTGSTSMSSHISEAIKALEKSGIKYQLTPMGTVIEVSSIDEAFNAMRAAHEAVIKKGVKRVVMHITIDDRRDAPKGMEEKIESVKSKI
jgi:uncharacterized protein (TIGR00106 family)